MEAVRPDQTTVEPRLAVFGVGVDFTGVAAEVVRIGIDIRGS